MHVYAHALTQALLYAHPNTGMCEAPSAATATSGMLANPIPVWWLVMATGFEHHAAAAKDLIFREYVDMLAAALVPHLAATPAPRLDWVAIKTKKLGKRAFSVG